MKFIDKLTGKECYNDAVDQYEKICKRYEGQQKSYTKEVERLCGQLRENIKQINEHKEYIQRVQFKKLVDMLSLLKDMEVPKEFCEEAYKKQCKNLDDFTAIQSRDNLFTIDFDKHKLKTGLQAIFTLGFYTRFKAKKSKEQVEDYVVEINDSIVKMNGELARLEGEVKAADDAEHYLDSMSKLFDKWLSHMQHAVHYVTYATMRIQKRVAKRSISISLLHREQQEELNATINLGKILSTLIRKQIVLKEKENNLKEYRDQIKAEHDKYINQVSA